MHRGKQDLADLAPKDCFIAAKSVERVAGQIDETQKATCEVGCSLTSPGTARCSCAAP